MQFAPTTIPDVILIEPKFLEIGVAFLWKHIVAIFVSRQVFPKILCKIIILVRRRELCADLHYQIRQTQGNIACSRR